MKQRYFSKSFDRYVFDRHAESDKYENKSKEKRKHKKRRRSRSESSYDYNSDSEKRHSLSRREEKYVKAKYRKKLYSPDNEGSYGNHCNKRENSQEDYKKHKKDISKGKLKSREKNCDLDNRKSKTESTESIKVKMEIEDEKIKKRIHKEPREEKEERSRPSGSGTTIKREVHEWGSATEKTKSTKQVKEVQKPNFGLSGKLTEDTNMYNGVLIKYSEPPEARMPKKRWRLYPFKGDQELPTLYIHRQSAYLLGRDRKVVDIPIDHPSCSKQHAALQYRSVSYQRPNGTMGKQIRLYIIDLESANGTFVNNNKIETKKYVELFEKDVIKFGYSSREYVLLHEHSRDSENSEDEL